MPERIGMLGAYEAEVTCPRCDGEEIILVCIDDLCHGAGECMHGDGEITCPECGGEGYVMAMVRNEEEEDI